MKYGELSLGQIEALVNKLGGMEGVKRFLADRSEVILKKDLFERNEHGHIVLTITGLDLTGAQEIEQLIGAGYRSDYVESCFTSTSDDSYDANHRLVAGKEYKIALIPGKEIKHGSERTTANLQKLGDKYGYGKPLAGIIPRIRGVVSNEMMEEMGVYYIAALHEPIKGFGGVPSVLDARRNGDGPWVNATYVEPGHWWNDRGSFAFFVPAS